MCVCYAFGKKVKDCLRLLLIQDLVSTWGSHRFREAIAAAKEKLPALFLGLLVDYHRQCACEL